MAASSAPTAAGDDVAVGDVLGVGVGVAVAAALAVGEVLAVEVGLVVALGGTVGPSDGVGAGLSVAVGASAVGVGVCGLAQATARTIAASSTSQGRRITGTSRYTGVSAPALYSGGFLDNFKAQLEQIRSLINAGEVAVPRLPTEKVGDE